MRIVRIQFSQTVLAFGGIDGNVFSEMINALPKGSSIVGWREDPTTLSSYIFITSPSFKEVPQGQQVPEITPSFQNDGINPPSFVEFDFNNTLETVSSLAASQGITIKVGATPQVQVGITKYQQLTAAAPFRCDHQWAFYRGLAETYQHCANCGQKKT